jgi:hypothetical protein
MNHQEISDTSSNSAITSCTSTLALVSRLIKERS